MGTGKSTVGKLVAAQLHFELVDTDQLVEKRAGKPITDIFAQSGEAAFRLLEKEVVAELQSADKTVIATGGGLGADRQLLASLKQHAFVVCLWASPAILLERVQHQTHRPLLHDADPLQKIRQLLASREDAYREADALVSTELRSVREVANQVLHQFHLFRQRPLS